MWVPSHGWHADKGVNQIMWPTVLSITGKENWLWIARYSLSTKLLDLQRSINFNIHKYHKRLVKCNSTHLQKLKTSLNRHETQFCLESHPKRICLNDFRHCMREYFSGRHSLLPLSYSGKITELKSAFLNVMQSL